MINSVAITYKPLLQPAQAGRPFSSLICRILSPFLTSAAIMAGFQSKVIREPLISTLSFGSILVSWFSIYHAGPKWTEMVSFSVLPLDAHLWTFPSQE